MEEIVQIVGSLLVLVPFVFVQLGRMTSNSLVFLALNFVGSGILAINALVGHQWGFLLLEGVWSIVSLVGVIRTLAGRPSRSPAAH